jgi:multiple sugar transport system ATP-binding protein
MLRPTNASIGFLFQNYALWPHMTVEKNIAFGLENLKWDKPRIKARVTELLDKTQDHPVQRPVSQ